MPDLHAQLQPHEDYVELAVSGYSVWWRDDEGVKWSGHMPRRDVDKVVRHLNRSYYPIAFWRTPVYRWERLLRPREGIAAGP